jgi:hypothetical protein
MRKLLEDKITMQKIDDHTTCLNLACVLISNSVAVSSRDEAVACKAFISALDLSKFVFNCTILFYHVGIISM